MRNPFARPGGTRGATAPGVLPGGPEAVQVGARAVQVGDDHAATLAVIGYPAEVGPGWLEPLLSYPGRLDVALHVEPIPAAVAASRLKKQRARLESTRRADAAKGRLDDPDLDAAADDAAALASRLARGHGRLFRVGIYLTVHADTAAELVERVAQVRALAAGMLLDTVPATWRALQGWTTGALPLAADSLNSCRSFDTDALAAAFPFASPDLPATSDGVLFGLNLSSSGVVVWNRWAADNYNSVILARSGAGKSYLAKLDLLRNLYTGVQAAVIDPEDEYLHLADAVGGTLIRPGAPGVRINPLDLPATGQPDELTRRALFCHTLLHILLGTGTQTGHPPLPPEAAAALDAAVLDAYAAKGITTDPRTWRRPAPLLADLAEALHHHGNPGQQLAARLTPFTRGSFSQLFAGPTTTPSSGHLVVYALKDLPDELKPVGTLLTLDAVWRTVSTTPPEVRKLVVVDEAWLLLRDGAGARFLFRLAKSARKYGAGLSVVTQDVGDVLGSDLGRAVVSNAATQILLRQAPQAIDALVEAFGLTDGERAFLLSAGRGDALLAGGSARVAFHSYAAPDTEESLVLTGPSAQP
jgi:type IV secretory system conjugative DNA transfer VirD4/TraG family protein